MMRLPHAALIGLFALPAAGQGPPEVWFSPCGGPNATCMTAQASDIADATPLIDHLDGNEEPESSACIESCRDLLARWESASQSHLPVTEAERLRLRYTSPERSEQELQLACEFQGPIDADDLARRYDWAVVADENGVIRLAGTPKEMLERLFYDRFTVTLDATTWRPFEVDFDFGEAIAHGGINGIRCSAIALYPWIGEGVTETGAIRLVGFESKPEADERPFRTADLSGEPPRLLRDDSPLVLPPAPIPSDFAMPLEPVEAPRPSHANEPTVLREVLERYDCNYASADRRQLELFRWRYDTVFTTEQRDRVEIWLEDRSHGWLETHPHSMGSKASTEFTLKESVPDGWRWEGDLITHYDPITNVCQETLRRPAEFDGARFWCFLARPVFALPIWTDESADTVRERFALRRVPTADQAIVHVVATPLTDDDKANYQRIDIRFDRATGRPLATRMLDPAGTGYTILSEIKIELDGLRPPVRALKPTSKAVAHSAPSSSPAGSGF